MPAQWKTLLKVLLAALSALLELMDDCPDKPKEKETDNQPRNNQDSINNQKTHNQ